MKNINIGIANLIIANKLKDSYFNNMLYEESKTFVSDFFSVIKNSPILQLEFKVFDNLENKHIENEISATRYIDNNIKLFETYTISEIDNERAKLNQIIGDEIIPIGESTPKIELYEAIDVLITESLLNPKDIDVDKIHESFTKVLNHIKTSKAILIENVDNEDQINEGVIELAITKYNEKYESMPIEDRNLLETLIKSNEIEMQKILETYKNDCILLLKEVVDEDVSNNVTKSIVKINEMKYNKNCVINDIIKLYELKKDLK
jgi:hypothetical protein